jgi:hypothetical protein
MRTRRRFFSDTTPLRESAQYRRLYLGQLFAIFGSQITVVAVPLQVYLITGSSLLVGLSAWPSSSLSCCSPWSVGPSPAGSTGASCCCGCSCRAGH